MVQAEARPAFASPGKHRAVHTATLTHSPGLQPERSRGGAPGKVCLHHQPWCAASPVHALGFLGPSLAVPRAATNAWWQALSALAGTPGTVARRWRTARP